MPTGLFFSQPDVCCTRRIQCECDCLFLLQVGWRLTVQWLAGNLACKVFLFLRAFGLYLSSNVLVCVSLDRYFAILHPLRVNDARRRGKFMLACAWIVSLLWSVPQVSWICVIPCTCQHTLSYAQLRANSVSPLISLSLLPSPSLIYLSSSQPHTTFLSRHWPELHCQLIGKLSSPFFARIFC